MLRFETGYVEIIELALQPVRRNYAECGRDGRIILTRKLVLSTERWVANFALPSDRQYI